MCVFVRERETVCVCVRVCERKGAAMYVCERESARETVCVSECVREKGSSNASFHNTSGGTAVTQYAALSYYLHGSMRP
jgi:hypothetical protein